jgi:pyruvate/2-oxoglutarate dehydrogenase complex dihydrolipoamide acyltransferase (E2) component
MTEIKIPQAGVAMTSGTLVSWLAADGAEIAAGQPIYLLGADKIEMEIEAPVGGILKHICAAGEDYDVGTTVATVE